MRFRFGGALLALVMAFLPPLTGQVFNPASGPTAAGVSAGTAYTQNFNTLASTTGTSSTLPDGWAMRETGTNANGTYTVGTGSSNAGDTYSFGLASNTDRAFGSLLSGSVAPTMGAKFVNNGSTTITSLAISFTGEQWRRGNTTAGAADRLNFEYSLDATTTLGTGTWTAVTALNFSSCNTAGATSSGGPLCTTSVSSTISGLSILPGQSFWIRWVDFDLSPGADDGLAIDDFSMTPGGGVSDPIISISSASIAEGNSGTTTLSFQVSLNQARTVDTVFNFSTANGAGPNFATAGVDYEPVVNGTGTIQANQLSTTVSVTLYGDTAVEPDETFAVNLLNIPTGVSTGTLAATGTILNDDVAPVTCTPTNTISAIQGTGLASPLVGSVQITQGIVTARGDTGFFVQEPVTNPDTPASQGIFVFTSSAPPAAATVGNNVCVTGTVTENFTETQLSSATVSVVSSGNLLPAAVALTTTNLTPNGGFHQLERFEGMLVSIAGAVVTAPTDGFGEAAVTLPAYSRPFREPGIPVSAGGPQGNCPQTSGENPNQAGCVPRFDDNPENVGLDTDGLDSFGSRNLAAGMTFDVSGPLRYTFGAYKILPGTLPATLPDRTPVSTAGGDKLTVATFNVENYTGGAREVLAVDNIKNFLKNPDLIGLQEVASESALNSLATALNTANGGTTNYQPVWRQSPDTTRNNVFLYNANRVTLLSVTQYPAETFAFCGTNDTLNDRRPLAFRGQVNTPGAIPYLFTAVNFHQRSLNDVESTALFNDGQAACPGVTVGERVRFKRAKQAEYAAALLDELHAAGQEVIALGDMNSFQFNDGYVDVLGTMVGQPAAPTEALQSTVDLNEPNFTALVNTLPAAQRYSYVFEYHAQTLDHALVNPKLLARNPVLEYARVDADFPESVRLSDHDPGRVAIPLPTATLAEGVTVTRSGMLFDRLRNKWRTTFTIRNNSGQNLASPLHLVLTNLAPAGVTVDNPTGVSDAFGATPAPYVALPGIPNGGQVQVLVLFNAAAGTQITFNAQVYRGTL